MAQLGRAWLLAVVAFLYLPIAVMIVMAFNASPLYALPIQPSLIWFDALASDAELLDATRNSLIIATFTAVIATALARWRRSRWHGMHSAAGRCCGCCCCHRSRFPG